MSDKGVTITYCRFMARLQGHLFYSARSSKYQLLHMPWASPRAVEASTIIMTCMEPPDNRLLKSEINSDSPTLDRRDTSAFETGCLDTAPDVSSYHIIIAAHGLVKLL